MDAMQTTAPVAAPAQAATRDTGAKSYLVMVVLAFFAGATGLARAYRGDTVGWVRFWIYVGSMILMFIPFINILAALGSIVVGIWGIVDFFLVYRLREDTEGKPLHATVRDQKWAGVFNVIFIVGLALSAVMIVLGIIFSAAFINYYKDKISPSDITNTSITESFSEDSTPSDTSSAALSNYANLKDDMSRSEAEATLGVTSDDCSEFSFGDSKTETCSYGGYNDGYLITLSFTDDKLTSKSKYQY